MSQPSLPIAIIGAGPVGLSPPRTSFPDRSLQSCSRPAHAWATASGGRDCACSRRGLQRRPRRGGHS